MAALTAAERQEVAAITRLYQTWARDVAPDDLDVSTVKRMVFARWLVATGRLNEGS